MNIELHTPPPYTILQYIGMCPPKCDCQSQATIKPSSPIPTARGSGLDLGACGSWWVESHVTRLPGWWFFSQIALLT
ncbi:hypothetical protein XELAEV_18042608mg [Xenopus laevis]|uniref:Uncharacterized protein n=1 Tax=Xenopus laevis TaxID=8355 RepID=A0A974C488_XENLA|nr:hypothetical protein XELAEV_18042608mg [Xenopus laevis]